MATVFSKLNDQTNRYRSFAEALRRLNENDGVTYFSSLIENGLPALEQQLHLKEEKLKETEQMLDEEKKKRESDRQIYIEIQCNLSKKYEEKEEYLQIKVQNLFEKIRQQSLAENLAVKREEDLNSQVERLVKDIEDKNSQVDAAKSAINQAEKREKELDNQLKELSKDLKIEENKLVDSRSENARLESVLQEKQSEIDACNKTLQHERATTSNFERQLMDLKKEYTSLKVGLASTRESLSRIRSFAKPLTPAQDDEPWLASLDQIWQATRKLCQNIFKDDLTENILNDSSVWREMEEYPYIQQIPLPKSNTPAAKNMRVVALLAIIARELHHKIFVSTYLFDQGHELQREFRQIAMKNPDKEAFIRAIFLGIESELNIKKQHQRVKALISRVCDTVNDLIPSAKCDELEQELSVIVHQGLNQWQKVRSSKIRYETSFELGGADYDDSHATSIQLMFEKKKDTNPHSQSNGDAKDEKLIVIFPRVKYYDEDWSGPVNNAVYLMKAQISAAKGEIQKKQLEEKQRSEKELGSNGKLTKFKTRPYRQIIGSGTRESFFPEVSNFDKPGKG